MAKVKIYPAEGVGAHIRSVDELSDIVELTRNPAYADYKLTSAEAILLNDDGITWSKVPNMILGSGSDFSVAGGILTCGKDGTYLVNGALDIESDKTAEISVSFRVDGVIVPSEISRHTVTHQDKVENMSMTGLFPLTAGQELEVYVKGDGTLTTTVTIDKMNVTFHQIGW